MRRPHPARERLRALLRRPPDQLDLADAALCVAWEDRGRGDPDATLALLDALADGARPAIAGAETPDAIVGALNRYLFEEYGLRGNTWSYGDPANSYLDQVLESRAGLPITLSLIYLEVARRLALPVVGVALPGHFIVRYLVGDGGPGILIDPFHRGRRWSEAECATQVRLFYGRADEASMRAALTPPTARQILARMLRNLKAAYIQHEEPMRALACAERILLIEPRAADELRDSGLLRARMGLHARALEDFERYARMAPAAGDLDAIRRHARLLGDRLGRSN